MQSNVYVGIKPGLSQLNTVGVNASSVSTEDYDYTLLPITNFRYREVVKNGFDEFYQCDEVDRVLEVPEPQLQDVCIPPFHSSNKNESSPSHIGLLSSWLELDSDDYDTRLLAYKVLLNEMKYAKFIGITKLILAPPKKLTNLHYYSQIILRLLKDEMFSSTPLILSISLPLFENSDPLATWELWNSIRKMCNYHRSLTISLAAARTKTPTFVLNRWLSEPVSCILISSSIFATNQHDYPVLNKFNQHLIHKFQRVNGNSYFASGELCIILHGMEKYSNHVKGGEASYLDYINYILKKEDQLINLEKNDTNSIASVDTFWLPGLLPPLKPNTEQLTNQVYSIFEKDKIKYDYYQKAIQMALQDHINSSTTGFKKRLHILVAGAGRGPLVERAFDAVNKLNISNMVKIVALEKNPQAFLYLQKRKFDKWGSKVDLINGDMKTWKDDNHPPFDMVISELFGSFGCNELAPECLYNIERRHTTNSTIFIPESYSSYVAPVSVPLLHQELKQNSNDFEKPVILHNIPYCILSSRVNEIWSFSHPQTRQSTKNLSSHDLFNKTTSTEFKIKHKGEIDAFIGYFTAKLYGNTYISTLPPHTSIKLLDSPHTTTDKDTQNGHTIDDSDTQNLITNSNTTFSNLKHTEKMQSWSPIVFPLKQSVQITDDTEISACFNRIHCKLSKKIWYEWSLESFIYLAVSSPQQDHQQYTTDSTTHTKSNPHQQDATETDISQSSKFDNLKAEPNAFEHYSETGWQSVNDIHELTTNSPTFNLNTNKKNDTNSTTTTKTINRLNNNPQERNQTDLEIHLRIRTGSTILHNVNGHAFSIPL